MFEKIKESYFLSVLCIVAILVGWVAAANYSPLGGVYYGVVVAGVFAYLYEEERLKKNRLEQDMQKLREELKMRESNNAALYRECQKLTEELKSLQEE